jgi:hypothetical protein
MTLSGARGRVSSTSAIYTFVAGDKYEGEWCERLYHGQGTYTFAGGDNYWGGWREGGRRGGPSWSGQLQFCEQ